MVNKDNSSDSELLSALEHGLQVAADLTLRLCFLGILEFLNHVSFILLAGFVKNRRQVFDDLLGELIKNQYCDALNHL